VAVVCINSAMIIVYQSLPPIIRWSL